MPSWREQSWKPGKIIDVSMYYVSEINIERGFSETCDHETRAYSLPTNTPGKIDSLIRQLMHSFKGS